MSAPQEIDAQTSPYRRNPPPAQSFPKVSGEDAARFSNLKDDERQSMLQRTLAERFHLTAHREPRELGVYALTQSNNAPKLLISQASGGSKPAHSVHFTGRYELVAQGVAISDILNFLSQATGRFVVDQTNPKGFYDFKLKWAPAPTDPGYPARSGEEEGPSIFTAVKEQLGLTLRPSKAEYPVLVIESVDRPTPN